MLASEETASKKGLLQGIDPRAKLGAIAVLSVMASLIHSPVALGGLYALGVALAAASRVKLGSLVRKVWLSAGLFSAIIALPATTSLVTPGITIATIGPVAITKPGAFGAITLVMRVIASANFALLIALTTRWSDTLRGLAALKVPGVFTMTLGMAHRYAVSLLRTVQQIHLAKESRAIAEFPAAEERRWVAGRMAFAIKKSVKMSGDVYDAMLSRGYSGEVRSLMPLKADARDFAFLASIAIFCAVLFAFSQGAVI